MLATLDAESLAAYVGRYGKRTITADGGALYLQRNDTPESHTDGQGRRVLAPKLKLLPDGPDAFVLERIPTSKVEFVRDASGHIAALRVLMPDGTWEVTTRDER